MYRKWAIRMQCEFVSVNHGTCWLGPGTPVALHSTLNVGDHVLNGVGVKSRFKLRARIRVIMCVASV